MIAKKMMKHLLIILLWTSISFGQGYQERKNEFKRSLSNIIVELSAGNGYFIGTFYDLENEKTDTLQISDYPITYKDALKARKDCNNHILKLLAENNYESVLDYEGKKLLAYNELCRLFKDGKALGLIAKIRQNELIAANSNIKNTAHIKNRPQPQNLRKGGFNFFFGFPKAQFGFSIFTLRKSKLGIYGDLRIGIPIRGSSDNPNYPKLTDKHRFPLFI